MEPICLSSLKYAFSLLKKCTFRTALISAKFPKSFFLPVPRVWELLTLSNWQGFTYLKSELGKEIIARTTAQTRYTANGSIGARSEQKRNI